MHCPCGLNQSYDACCGRFIHGNALPATPEELMRSRYAAYTQANIDYIAQTMTGPAAKRFNAAEAADWVRNITWLNLEVMETSGDNKQGFVEFIAQFSHENKKYILHELSEFHFINDRWFYVDGKTPVKQPFTNTNQPSRNDPCACGSGKKFKKCCGLA